jgi:hypothetical protein
MLKISDINVFYTLRDLAGGHHDSRTSAEGLTGIGGTALYGWDLSVDDFFLARARLDDDA